MPFVRKVGSFSSMSVIARVRTHIAERPVGEPITVSAFLSLGSRAAVDQALSRLVRSGTIERVARGVYVRPKVSRYAGTVMPSVEKVVTAIAAGTGERVQVHGAEAARRFGLTTQAPIRPVFSTSGSDRRLHIGSVVVEFKHTAARKLVLAGRPSGDALAALWYVGKGAVTPETVEQIRRRLPPDEFRALLDARRVMPAWMATAVSKSLRGGSDVSGVSETSSKR